MMLNWLWDKLDSVRTKRCRFHDAVGTLCLGAFHILLELLGFDSGDRLKAPREDRREKTVFVWGPEK